MLRERLMRAALKLVDRDGLEGLSLRRLAAEVGVTPMAIYRHVPHKNALLDGVLDAVLTRLAAPSAEGTWLERARALAVTFRQLLKAHPNVVPLLARGPTLTLGALRLYEQGLRILKDSGLDDETVVRAYATLYSYTLGFAAVELGRANATPRHRPPAPSLLELAPYVHTLPAGEFRTLIELSPRIGRFTDVQFMFGLDALLDGLRARAESAVTRRARRQP